MNNDEVERCITAKIRTWEFPKPKGGGIVIVKLPLRVQDLGLTRRRATSAPGAPLGAFEPRPAPG
jgi:hypothetical protein